MRKALEHSPKREKLIQAAEQLMLTRGYSATSVDNICETAGVTKGSFFHYFENKEQAASAALDHFWSVLGQTIREAAFNREADPLMRLYGYLNFAGSLYENPSFKKGCLIGNLTQELHDSNPKIRKQCNGYFSDWNQTLERDLTLAKEQYAPEQKIDTKSLADHIISVLEGAVLLSKARQDKEVIEQSVGHLKEYLKNVFGR